MSRSELLAKLRMKRRGLSSVRKSGGRMQSKQTMNNMTEDEPDEDMFNDMKGMKKKDMKKAMGSMVDGMDDKQVDAMISNMKTKLPPAQAHEMAKYIRSKHALSKKKQDDGPQVNAKTVHKDISELTEEEKANKRTVKPKKAPRSFEEMKVSMPKLSDLGGITNDTKEEKVKQDTGPHMISDLPVDITADAPDDASAIRDLFASKDNYNLDDQMAALKSFKSSDWDIICKEIAVEQGHQFPLVHIDSVDMVKLDEYVIDVKNSQVIPFPPPDASVALEKNDTFQKGKYVYTKHGDSGKYVKYKNLKPVYENERLRYLKWVRWLRQYEEPIVWHLVKSRFERLGIYVQEETSTSTTFYGRVPGYEILLCNVITKK